MPGLLIMNQNGAHGSAGAKDPQDRNGDTVIPLGNTKPMMNGDRAPQVDGPVARGGAFSINGGKQAVAGQVDIPASLMDLPPEIVHIAGVGVYTPFSTLLSRVAQECFNGLSETLTAMADLPVTQQPGLTNGLGNHAVNGAGNTTVNNTRKKQIMMEFAELHRTRFVKLLVLSSWARQSEQVQKLIDVLAWTKEQDFQYYAVVDALGNLKREMEHATLKSPDIQTALQVLATGKAPWMPHLGYIPPEPLSAQEIMKLWRDINVRCSIRLNLHEDLPRHLKQWTIGSGRVTFTIPSEFELDVSTSTEDSSQPWYFLDLRLLFSPAPEIPDSHFRSILETEANKVLTLSGLNGCFDFLHNLVLTHKITVLKAQAFQLAAANWAGSIKVEPVRRSLVVQYWTEVPGKKSWIEIGIVSGKPKNGKVSWKGPTPPLLAVRWFRQGMEVKEPGFSFDWQTLSMEDMLRKVIAHHISYVLETIQDRLVASARGIPTLKTELSSSETEPSDCALQINLAASTASTTVLMDPVTGRLAMQPCTAISANIENEVNRSNDPFTIMSARIPAILCATLLVSVEQQAQLLGWTRSTVNLRTDSIKDVIKQDVVRHALFRARGWAGNWVLAVVLNLSGMSWWVIDSETSSTGVSITTAELVHGDTISTTKDLVLREVMTAIQRKAVAKISLSTTSKSLTLRRVPHSIILPPGNRTATQELFEIPSIWIDAVAFLKAEQQGEEPWAQTLMRVQFSSFDIERSNVRISLDGVMATGFESDITTIMNASRSSDIQFYGENNSKFRVSVLAAFGTSLDRPLAARLREITHLLNFISIFRARKFVAERITPNRISFRYAATYTATVYFAPDQKIKLAFPRSNPHHRVRAYLAAGMNAQRRDPAKFRAAINTFAYHLLATLPLLRALDSLSVPAPEGKEKERESEPVIHPHTPDAFRITYKNPKCSFDANLRVHQDRRVWHIEDNSNKNQDQRAKQPPAVKSETLKNALEALWREDGEDWEGVRTGIVAGIEGVAAAVERLDKVVRGCWVEGGEQPEEVVKTKVVGLGISNPVKVETKPVKTETVKEKDVKPIGPKQVNNRKMGGPNGSGGGNGNMRNGGAGPDIITID